MLAVMTERDVSKDHNDTATRIFEKRNCTREMACSWLRIADGANEIGLEQLKCGTSTATSGVDNVQGDGCQETIPSKENVTNILKRDVESDFVELFIKLRLETRQKIGHYFLTQNDSLEGQPLQGFIRSCRMPGQECGDIRWAGLYSGHLIRTTQIVEELLQFPLWELLHL